MSVCVMTVRDEAGNVYLHATREGRVVVNGRARVEATLVGHLTAGGPWPASAAVWLVQFDPRFHQVKSLKGLTGPVVKLPSEVCELSGGSGSLYVLPCRGPKAKRFHQRGRSPDLERVA